MALVGLARLKTGIHKLYSNRGAHGKKFRTRTMLPTVTGAFEYYYRIESNRWHF